jgi:molybdopterin converting factor small subunit
LSDSIHGVRVEFFGIPRERAGVMELELQADTLGQLLTTLAIRFPSLGELVQADRLRSPFLANLNGARFVSDPGTQLTETDCVLILSADAGG